MKFRPHRQLLADSMAAVVELESRAALVTHLRHEMAPWGSDLIDADVKVAPYGLDDRIGWNTYIVTVRNHQDKAGNWFFGSAMGPNYFGAVGFTDSPLEMTP